MTIIQIITVFAVFQGTILALVLFLRRKGNLRANRWLASLILAFMLGVVVIYVQHTDYYLLVPHFFVISTSIIFLLGPFFFFYVRDLTSVKYKFRWVDALNFTPFLLYVTILLIWIIPQDTNTLVDHLKEMSDAVPKHPRFSLLPALKSLHLLIYTIVILMILKKYSTQIKNNFSNLDKINLRWLRYFVSIFICMQLVNYSLPYISYTIGGEDVWRKSDMVFGYFMAFFIFFAGYAGLVQPEIFTSDVVKTWIDLAEISTVKSLPENNIDSKFHHKLVEEMRTNKLFLDNELSLSKLADAVGVSPHQLSRLINSVEEKNFFEFVNYYRVQESMRMLADKSFNKFTIIQIAFDSGFNNKNSFNKAFKNITGITPYEYKKQHQG